MASTLKSVKKRYDRLRRLYFLDAEEPLKIPPTSRSIRWYWLPPTAGFLALTEFDEEWEPTSIGIDPMLGKADAILLTTTLLHELLHIRDPRIGGHSMSGCSTKSSAWKSEVMRLASLGAPLL